jgi:HAD superfamily hydrolase (TIGR01450 family)
VRPGGFAPRGGGEALLVSGHGRQETGGAPLGNVVCDLDGVVYLMDTAVPGAGVALSDIERRGYRLLFATNAAIRTPESVAAHIASVSDYPAQAAQVVTSAMVAAEVLSAADCPVLVVGEAGLSATLQQSGLRLSNDPREARSVVVGLDRRLTYDRLRVAAAALLAGARFVATNRDPTFHLAGGRPP